MRARLTDDIAAMMFMEVYAHLFTEGWITESGQKKSLTDGTFIAILKHIGVPESVYTQFDILNSST